MKVSVFPEVRVEAQTQDQSGIPVACTALGLGRVIAKHKLFVSDTGKVS